MLVLSAWTLDDVRNGVHWQAPFPQCWEGISQWLEHDKWVLLCDEDKARHGGTCRMAHSMKFGGTWKVIVTQAELCEYLNRLPWSKLRS